MKPLTSSPMIDDLPAFLTVQEYADLLRVSKWAVYDAIKSGQIKAIRVGRSLRIPRSAINDQLGESNGD